MIPINRLGAALAAMLLLSACQSGPDYHEPIQALAPYHTETAHTAVAPPLDRWWTGFHDAELAAIVDRALAQNLDLVAALARVQQARAVARETGSRLLPAGSVQASAAPC